MGHKGHDKGGQYPRTKLPTATADEIDQAVSILFDAVEARPEHALCHQELAEARRWSPRNARRKRLGKGLIRRYRLDTNNVGAINWKKFAEWVRAWLKEHAAEINFLRLIVSILTLLIML